MSTKVRFYPTRYGLVAHNKSDRHIGRSLERYGEWAQEEIVTLLPLIPEGGVVLDVGAHVGTHAIPFARKVGSDGRVLAFEAQPEIATLLSAGVVANDLTEIIVVLNALVGRSVATREYSFERRLGGGNQASRSFVEAEIVAADGKGSLNSQLAVLTIDSLDLLACHFIKIDVEGMELDVLEGAKETLNKYMPTIYFEQRGEAQLKEIRSLLSGLGYRLYWHVANPFNVYNYCGSKENIFDGHTEVNILALPIGVKPPEKVTEIISNRYTPPVPSLLDGLAGVALLETEVQFKSPDNLWASIVAGCAREALEGRRELEKELSDVSARLGGADEARSHLSGVVSSITGEVGALRGQLATANAEIGELRSRLRDKLLALGAADRDLQRSRSEHSALRMQLDEKSTALEGAEKELAFARQEKISGEAGALEALRSSERRLAEARGSLQALKAQNAFVEKKNRIISAVQMRSEAQQARVILGAHASKDREPFSDDRGPYIWREHKNQDRSIRRRDIDLVLESRLFDADWYKRQRIARFGSSPRYPADLVEDYLKLGWQAGLEPHPLFCSAWYAEREVDVRESGLSPLEHFLRYGRGEWRDPHPLFATRWYVDKNPEAGAHPGGPIAYFIEQGIVSNQTPHPLFSPEYYLETYVDLNGYEGGAFLHYLKHGGAEGRHPHPLFDATWYAGRYRKRGLAHTNLLADLVISGLGEERDPNPLFLSRWYRASHRDLIGSDLSSLAHYAVSGEKEGRQPNPLFDPVWYSTQAGLAHDVWPGALAHYLHVGRGENRSPHPLFDPEYYRRGLSVDTDLSDGLLAHALRTGGVDAVDPHPLFSNEVFLSDNPFALEGALPPVAYYLAQPREKRTRPTRLFDPKFYLFERPDLLTSKVDPLVHYIEFGDAAGYRPCALFDPQTYRSRYPETTARHKTTLEAYLLEGAAFMHDPHWLFCSRTYLRSRPDALRGSLTPLEHFLEVGGVELASAHPFFDVDWYVERYADELPATDIPLVDYINTQGPDERLPNRYTDPDWLRRKLKRPGVHGAALVTALMEETNGRGATHPLIDCDWYASIKPEAASYLGGPAAYFIRVGEARGDVPTPLFDAAFYASTYPELADTTTPAFRHYVLEGAQRRLRPNRLFDAEWYARQYALDDGKGDALAHYVESGGEAAFAPDAPAPRRQGATALPVHNRLARLNFSGAGGAGFARRSMYGEPSSLVFVTVSVNESERCRALEIAQSLVGCSPSIRLVPIFDVPLDESAKDALQPFTDLVDISEIGIPDLCRLLFLGDAVSIRQLTAAHGAFHYLERPDCKGVVALERLPNPSDAVGLELHALLPEFERALQASVISWGQTGGGWTAVRASRAGCNALRQSIADHVLRIWAKRMDESLESKGKATPDQSDASWPYAVFDNGELIDEDARRIYACNSFLQAEFPCPFKVDSSSYYRWLDLRRYEQDGKLRLIATSHPTQLHKALLSTRG